MNFLSWILVSLAGAGVGLLTSILVDRLKMPALLLMSIGLFGALIGSALFQITGADILGSMTAYISAIVFSVCLCAGGVLAYSLTFANKRTR